MRSEIDLTMDEPRRKLLLSTPLRIARPIGGSMRRSRILRENTPIALLVLTVLMFDVVTALVLAK